MGRVQVDLLCVERMAYFFLPVIYNKTSQPWSSVDNVFNLVCYVAL